MPHRKQHYKEGDWFAVPLERGGYALGLIARMKGSAIFGYFFGKWFSETPTLADALNLQPSDAIERLIFGDLDLINRQWPVLGPLPSWDRAKWPMPSFKHKDVISGQWHIRTYNENYPNRMFHEERRATVGDVVNLPEDGTFGAGAVVSRLSRLVSANKPLNSQYGSMS